MSALPVRLKAERKAGFHLPEGSVYVGRPTRWGNPIKVGPGVDRKQAVEAYRAVLAEWPAEKLEAFLAPLRGKNLACWCSLNGEPCHADVLLELANTPERAEA